MSDNAVPGLQAMLHHLNQVRDEWFLIGIALGIPLIKLRDIEITHSKEGTKRWLAEMLQYWLDTTLETCWETIARALEQVDQIKLASTIKQKYLWNQPPTIMAPLPSLGACTESTVTAEIEADGNIVRQLRDLECEFSLMLNKLRKLLADCDVSDAQFFFSHLFDTDDFDDCHDVKVLLNKLFRNGYIDTFNVYPLEKVAVCLERDDMNKLVKEYEEKKKRFFNETTVVDFQRAVISKTKPCLSKGKIEVTIKIKKRLANERVLKDMEQLAAEAFEDNQMWFVHFHAIAGSIIVLWHAPEKLCGTLEELISNKIALLRESGVEEVTISGKTVFSQKKLPTNEGSQVVPRLESEQILKKVYHEFHHQLVDALSDHNIHHSIVSKLYTRAVLSQETMEAQMSTKSSSSLLTVLDKPYKLSGLITAMMEEEMVRPLAEEMAALLSKYDKDEPVTQDLIKSEISIVQEQEAMITQLNARLKYVEQSLEDANKLLIMRERLISSLLSEEYKKETELRERVKSVGKLEVMLESILPALVQVNGEGKVVATDGRETCIELIIPSVDTLSHISPLDRLSCQLIDPNFHNVECRITSTQLGMATVSYTPTQRGAHQLKITVGETDIPGSPFTVNVLPSLEKRGVPIDTITGINCPWDVAVSKSGRIIVSEYYGGHCISILSRDGTKITKFGSQGSSEGQFNGPDGVAITTDNHILVNDRFNHRIQLFTMEGKFLRSFGEKEKQFINPAGIAVHSSGLVFIADSGNHCIQVLHPDLSLFHKIGVKGSEPGQFLATNDVAFDSRGIVYVTDCNNHRVQSFSADGQFISSFGSRGTQPGQFLFPLGICIDSTDTVYITDRNHRVSVFNTHGQFLKCFGKKGNGEGELFNPEGIAVDDTTGNMYVCDYSNNRVVVY